MRSHLEQNYTIAVASALQIVFRPVRAGLVENGDSTSQSILMAIIRQVCLIVDEFMALL